MIRQRKIDATLLGSEVHYSTSRSSGPGGQNVNKVNTKATLKFDVVRSRVLTEEEKTVLTLKLASRLTTGGVLVLTAQDKRSQLQNKQTATLKLEKLIAKAFEKKKVRKATRPSKGAIETRITDKKQRSEKKQWRQKF